MIESCTSAESSEWLDLRQQLWPHCSREEHLAEMQAIAASPQRFAQFLAYVAPRRAIGLAEVSLRSDHVNGAESLPVPFLEGLFVAPAFRRQGFAAALMHAVEQWALSRGYRELSSDALAHNAQSHRVHRALGFQECERVVYFHKALDLP